MDSSIVKLNIFNFSLIYLLLIVVLIIMKKSKINQSKLLLIASFRMTLQLVLAGMILTYIFEKPHPIFVIAYLTLMVLFSLRRVLKQNPELSRKFKIAIVISLSISPLLILGYFVMVVVNENIFNPQYTIPLAGMIVANSMTGVSLAIRTFNNNIKLDKNKIYTLLNLGVTPKKILMPYVNRSLETALLPTLNNMVGMGIISLPGMMTGQILAGTNPNTAIMYQIAIMIAITTSTCLAVFSSLSLGYRTLYNKRNQFIVDIIKDDVVDS